MAKSKLDIWVERLSAENMPLFSRTVMIVTGTAARDDSSVSELAWDILQDPALTAQILKLSNSIYYNPAAKRINTISRAVMHLGFQTIRVMCLSIALVENVLGSLNRERVALEVARSFHAAVQAKALASRRQVTAPEEVFIAALLSRIGQVGFWSFAGEIGDKLEETIRSGDQREWEAEIEVLGFRLEWLTLRLCKEWKLSPLLESVLSQRNENDARTQSISLGYAIAQAAEEGWDSPASKSLARRVSEFLRISREEAVLYIHESARDAAAVTEAYGAKRSSTMIPKPRETVSAATVPIEEKREYPNPDQRVQFSTMKDLSALVSSGAGNMDMVFSILLEGVLRGIGMDRVMVAIVSPDGKSLEGKYGLGWPDEGYASNFSVQIDEAKTNIFGHTVNYRQPVWAGKLPQKEITALRTREVAMMIGRGDFYLMPITTRNRVEGVIYADRCPSGRDLDDESFESFVFFGQQASIALSALAESEATS